MTPKLTPIGENNMGIIQDSSALRSSDEKSHEDQDGDLVFVSYLIEQV